MIARLCGAALALLLLVAPSKAQVPGGGVSPYGVITPGDCAGWQTAWSIKDVGACLPLAGGTLTGTLYGADGAAWSASGLSNLLSASVTPAATATVATDQAQASGGTTLLAFASTSSIAVGQTVTATNVPLGDQVASIVSTAQVSQAANGSFVSGQKCDPDCHDGEFCRWPTMHGHVWRWRYRCR